ncbi:hypothetical protein GCM10008967_30550 [Bacillus carboniphilus]|uniref:Uncharacterized protein n=1 Tax=Bacillus carboniphilus TaxID=86663 RepID=A0ABP3GB02_9BACI
MRLFDEDNENVINNVSIFLTIDEAREMIDTLEGLLKSFENKPNHGHLNDETYQHEITISLYDDKNLDGLNERAKKLIRENK